MIDVMRSGLAVVSVTCAVAGACAASADGVILEVVPGNGVDVGMITHLDIWIGEPDPAGGPGEFLRNQRERDIQEATTWPFRVHVVAGDQPSTILAAAFGYPDEDAARTGVDPYVLGVLPAPVVVEPGVLRGATISLTRTFTPTADCAFRPARDGLPAVAIRPREPMREDVDCDNDGAIGDVDCDDLDADTNLGAPEICDARDNDCNGLCDDGLDADGDDFSQCDYGGDQCPGALAACADDAQVAPYTGSCDCDDTDGSAFPGATPREQCVGANDANCDGMPDHDVTTADLPGNQADEDCDGNCDQDDDGDLVADSGQVGISGTWAPTCEPVRDDCNDLDAEIYPNAHEACDEINSDCLEVDQVVTGACVIPSASLCQLGTRTCVDGIPGAQWSGCVNGAPVTDVVGNEVCEKLEPYAGAPWPERSMHEDAVAGGGPAATCGIDVWRPQAAPMLRVNQMCPAPRARLRNRLPWAFDQCETLVAVFNVLGGWELILVPRDPAITTIGTRVPTCDVDLEVAGMPGIGAPDVRLPALWFLVIQQEVRQDGTVGAAAAVPVEIRPHYATATTGFACPATPRSLTCDEI
jgi:hypothetical protein